MAWRTGGSQYPDDGISDIMRNFSEMKRDSQEIRGFIVGHSNREHERLREERRAEEFFRHKLHQARVMEQRDSTGWGDKRISELTKEERRAWRSQKQGYMTLDKEERRRLKERKVRDLPLEEREMFISRGGLADRRELTPEERERLKDRKISELSKEERLVWKHNTPSYSTLSKAERQKLKDRRLRDLSKQERALFKDTTHTTTMTKEDRRRLKDRRISELSKEERRYWKAGNADYAKLSKTERRELKSRKISELPKGERAFIKDRAFMNRRSFGADITPTVATYERMVKYLVKFIAIQSDFVRFLSL
eukprot:TRINITY_DN634_c2_g1_i4.p1 TRINITY_DN634_c2_g1~~TRINITY_DN634_c2_g1_i4.p1  ORF type:complete len:331 (+),score=99.42 TRINITY_DN634_c2_g1_i4:70-993(+)